MSEQNTCKICGGYIGNALVHAQFTSGSSVQSITFCPGHSATDADLYRPLTMVHEFHPENELMYIPAGSSIFPPSFDAFWQIVQGVAEEDSVYHDSNDDLYHCPFCNTSTDNFLDPFPHDKGCIVVKARTLMEWRNAQPKVSIQVHDDFSPAVSHVADIVREIAEKIKEVDGEVPRD